MAAAPVREPDGKDDGIIHSDGAPATRAVEGSSTVDRAVRVTVPHDLADPVGAALMDTLGPYEVRDDADTAVTLVFYPAAAGLQVPSSATEVLALLPTASTRTGRIMVEFRDVSRDWVEGWRDHFHPIMVGRVRIRPPWEQALEAVGSPSGGGGVRSGSGSRRRTPVEVVINPGLGFGTGLHPTTRGTLQLLQLAQAHSPASRGVAAGRPKHVGSQTGGDRPLSESRRLVDAGTGSGILAVAAAKLGWGPVIAFDNDPAALLSARGNVEANAVEETVEVHETDVAAAPRQWFEGATVLANMTLEPVLTLVRKVGPRACGYGVAASTEGDRKATDSFKIVSPLRLVVSGILAGEQECELVRVAGECGLSPGQRLYEAEWVSMELLPTPAGPAVP